MRPASCENRAAVAAAYRAAKEDLSVTLEAMRRGADLRRTASQDSNRTARVPTFWERRATLGKTAHERPAWLPHGFDVTPTLDSNMKARWFFLGASLCACSGAAEIPDTPDLTALDREYTTPSGTLDLSSVNDVMARLPPLGDLQAGFQASGYATRSIDEASSSSSKDENSSVRIQGSIRVNLRCPGETADPVYDSATNGTIAVTIGVAENKIRRGIGGRATECVLRSEIAGVPVRVEIDGPIAFDLGHDVGLRTGWSGQLLMFIGGRIQIGEQEFSNLSARFKADRFEYLFRYDSADENKSVVAILSDDGVLIKDHDQTWVCPSGQPCGLGL